jgi:hypothetical protein
MEQYGLRNFKICAMYLLTGLARTSRPPKHSPRVILINARHTFLLALEKYPLCLRRNNQQDAIL